MKITLRKVKSVAIGEKYNADFFVPIHLPSYRSSVSVSVRGNAYSICEKYSIDFNDYDKADLAIYRKRKVIEVIKKISYIFVPSTHASKSSSIIKYSNQICDFVEFKDYLHFTHFGYLKTSFPSVQIKTILNIFLEKEDFECEVCWDIDEKYFKEMQELLTECLADKNKDINFDSYDTNTFVWSRDYDNWRESRNEARKERRLVHSKRITENYQRISNDYFNFWDTQIRSDEVVTRHINELPNIGAVAAGNAGEYYALSLFIRMGFVAGKAPEGTATYDLLVMSQDSFSFNPVQVKTITNGQHWLMKERHENVIDNLIYCFVLFSDTLSETRIFLIPSDVVAFALSMEVGVWLAIPGVNGLARNRNTMRTLKMDYSSLIRRVENPQEFLSRKQLTFIREHSFGWLDKYENNFDIFKTLD